MPLNSYFLQGSASEQRLVQDLINEQLKIYGQDVVYLPRKMVNRDTILNEVSASQFDDSYRIEAYLANYEGFTGGGDILSKFGVQSTDGVTLIISKERYDDMISPFLASDSRILVTSRPQEGDLIYLPLDNTMFEIKYVEAKKPFYQLNKLYVYQLSCEIMDAALDESVDTGIEAVDESVTDFVFTTRLTMVGTGATTATGTIQRAEQLGVIPGTAVGIVDLINDGTAYTTAPLIGITTAPVGGVNATAVAIMTSRTGQTGQSIDRIELTNPGFGYTVPPIITIRSQNTFGTGAAATAILADGALSAVTITDEGSGYFKDPIVTFSSPSLGAAATAGIGPGNTVISITLTESGVGYTAAPTVTIGVGTGTSIPSTVATATAIVGTGGTISGLTITNAGAGYTVTPTVTIDNSDSIKDFTGLTRATGTAQFNTDGEIISVRYTNAGVGYTAGVDPVTVTISAPVTGINTDNYLYKELVRGVSTGTTAYVSNWDADTRVLQVTNASSNFALGEMVVGIGTTQNGSDAAYKIQSISDQDEYDVYADNIEFETEADNILDFTERNPFGEF